MSGLYIHIPFCHSKCAYCDFYSTPSAAIDRERLCRCIAVEFQLRKHEIDNRFETLYFGGGTPSILSEAELATILEPLSLTHVKEMTIEVNPEDVSPRNVEMWRAFGFNRVSMGVQSFNDKELAIVGRRHNSAMAAEAFEILKAGGFKNISLDLIYGLPEQGLESWGMSVDRLLSLSPEHFSAYCLSYEPGTRLYASLVSGKIKETEDDILALMYEHLIKKAAEHGYDHYEISNFGKPGLHSRHNSLYWQMLPYLGLGPAAHSFDGNTRRFNLSSIKTYIQNIEQGKESFEIDVENETDVVNDIIFTALRTAKGLDLERIPEKYRATVEGILKRKIPLMPGVETCGSRVRIKESSWLVSDSIIREIMV